MHRSQLTVRTREVGSADGLATPSSPFGSHRHDRGLQLLLTSTRTRDSLRIARQGLASPAVTADLRFRSGGRNDARDRSPRACLAPRNRPEVGDPRTCRLGLGMHKQFGGVVCVERSWGNWHGRQREVRHCRPFRWRGFHGPTDRDENSVGGTCKGNHCI
jgi:hypothetical protein